MNHVVIIRYVRSVVQNVQGQSVPNVLIRSLAYATIVYKKYSEEMNPRHNIPSGLIHTEERDRNEYVGQDAQVCLVLTVQEHGRSHLGKR